MKTLIFLTIPLLLLGCLDDSSPRISGHVYDKESKEPIENATVRLEADGGFDVDKTDEGGSFSVGCQANKGAADNFAIIISKEGYHEITDLRHNIKGLSIGKSYFMEKVEHFEEYRDIKGFDR